MCERTICRTTSPSGPSPPASRIGRGVRYERAIAEALGDPAARRADFVHMVALFRGARGAARTCTAGAAAPLVRALAGRSDGAPCRPALRRGAERRSRLVSDPELEAACDRPRDRPRPLRAADGARHRRSDASAACARSHRALEGLRDAAGRVRAGARGRARRAARDSRPEHQGGGSRASSRARRAHRRQHHARSAVRSLHEPVSRDRIPSLLAARTRSSRLPTADGRPRRSTRWCTRQERAQCR